MTTVQRKADFKKNFYENSAWACNQVVCGVDEVGRGSLAGPVVAAAVILKASSKSRLVKDSKQLTPEERLQAYKWIIANSVYTVGLVDHRTIDRINIYQATLRAMKRAVMQAFAVLPQRPSFILVDAMPLRIDSFEGMVIAFPKGESKSLSIAAASIIAKVTRDYLMERLDHAFPGYAIGQHKGYCTVQHKSNLEKLGRSIMHRTTFIDHFQPQGELSTLLDAAQHDKELFW